ncbi:hypothetical protein [Paenibacillus xylanexedens]|uniref:hypothetical protein n=1 Tax=Paenibacillus xylanexedens TaxID=528191 RepID=UPI00119ED393|nr:hypothetical protein [Paenibacillus xylanexedens]
MERIFEVGWIQRSGAQLIWVILAVLVLQILLSIRNRMSKGSYTDEEIEQADPLFLAYVFNKGKMRLRDTLASLFALTRSGILSLRVIPTKGRYQDDQYAPNVTLEFQKTKQIGQIMPDEGELIQWFIGEHGFGAQKFRLDTLAGPSSEESKSAENLYYYREREKLDNKRLGRWVAQIRESRGWESIVRTPVLLRLLVGILYPVLFILVVALGQIDGLGIADIIGLSLALLLWLLSWRRVYVRWVFQLAVFSLFMTTVLMEGVQFAFRSDVLTAIIIMLFVRLFLPGREIAPMAREWSRSLHRWRRKYKKGVPTERLGEAAESLERVLQTALVLRIGSRCSRKTDWTQLQNQFEPEIRQMLQKEQKKSSRAAVSKSISATPLLLLVLSLRGEYRPLLAAEYPYERLNYKVGLFEHGTQKRNRKANYHKTSGASTSGTYTSSYDNDSSYSSGSDSGGSDSGGGSD